MYVSELSFYNAAANDSGVIAFRKSNRGLKKWHILQSPDAEKDSELLKILALAGSGCVEYLHHLPCHLQDLLRDQGQSLQLKLVWVEHTARKGIVESPARLSALEITPSGAGRRLRQKDLRDSSPLIYTPFSKWSPPARHLVFAYGSHFCAHDGSDDFDFSDPFYQLRRIHSLFHPKAPLTDPKAFLSNLHYRAIRHQRYMPAQILQNLQQAIQRHLALDTSNWMTNETDISKQWECIPPEYQRMLLPLLDAARHLHDALPSYPNPLHFPGMLLLDKPDDFCPADLFSDWIRLLDQLFPVMQCLLRLGGTGNDHFPAEKLCPKTLHLPEKVRPASPVQVSTGKQGRLPPKSILLVDVDGRLPNLALMKLAGFYKAQGRSCRLMKKEAYEPRAEAVFASSIFSFPASGQRLQKMGAYYGDSLKCGGSGFDIQTRLPPEVEAAEPDCDLYPELGDRAIGFLTRGCPFHCGFCIVPLKEGPPRQVCDIDSLTRGGEKKKLILLDDNILAHPDCNKLLQEIVSKKLQVNFNQTLDLHLVDAEKARLIRAIPCSNVKFTRTVYHFSLNDTRNLEELRQKYALFHFGAKENVEFICMYGYNTTLAEDLERFRFLRSLPGAYVFVQEYQPIPGGPEPQLKEYFDERADHYIDELVQICFPQSMKSMEKYFRWLSKRYALHFGRLHMGLVDTIFRYNKRYDRGRYIASLAGTKKLL